MIPVVLAALALEGCFLASSTASTFGAFRALPDGQSQAVAASGGHLITLNANSAVWWEDEAAVTASLPGIPVGGARWSTDGARLWVGPGQLDISTRTWSPHLAFAAILAPGPGRPVARAVAWSADAGHAAVLLEPPPPSPGARRPPSVVEVYTVGEGGAGAPPIRIEAPGARALTFVDDLLAIGGADLRLYAFDGSPGATVALHQVAKLTADGSTMAVLGVDGRVSIVDGRSGVVQATWAARFVDVAIQGNLLVAVDLAGLATAACWSAAGVEGIGSAVTGTAAPVVVLDGSTVVVAGRDGVRVGTITGTCPEAGASMPSPG